MADRRPVIGVTGPDRGGTAAWWCTALAVRRAGGIPVRITPRHPRADVRWRALILGGGADIEPERYGQRPSLPARLAAPESDVYDKGVFLFANLLRHLDERPCGQRIDPERDELEFSLLERALRDRRPVLGICRGEQLRNVFFGGTLHQELKSFYVEEPEVRSFLPRKLVTVGPATMLHRITAQAVLRVNGRHHQGVAELGRGLRVSARDRNGIVQALEAKSAPFVLGLQWHPEYLPQLRVQQRLFRALVEHARAAPQEEGREFAQEQDELANFVGLRGRRALRLHLERDR